MTLRDLGGTEFTFWAFALLGTVFFLLRVGLMIVGGFGADVHDAQMDAGHGPVSPADAHHAPGLEATEPAFKLLSIHSLTGFFMMFGWAGLAAYKQFGLGATTSFAVALFAGGVAMLSTAHLFRIFAKLQSPGDRFRADKAVGAAGTVYARIPAGGRGQVQVSVGGTARTLDAVAESGSEIASFAEIVVVRALDGRTVSVKPRS